MEVLNPFYFLWREFPSSIFFQLHTSLVLWHIQILMGSWVLPLWQHSSAPGNLNFASTTLLKLPLAGSPKNDIHAAWFNGYFSSVISLNSFTEFDTFDHSVLLEILSSLPSHDSILPWLSTFLWTFVCWLFLLWPTLNLGSKAGCTQRSLFCLLELPVNTRSALRPAQVQLALGEELPLPMRVNTSNCWA